MIYEEQMAESESHARVEVRTQLFKTKARYVREGDLLLIPAGGFLFGYQVMDAEFLEDPQGFIIHLDDEDVKKWHCRPNDIVYVVRASLTFWRGVV